MSNQAHVSSEVIHYALAALGLKVSGNLTLSCTQQTASNHVFFTRKSCDVLNNINTQVDFPLLIPELFRLIWQCSYLYASLTLVGAAAQSVMYSGCPSVRPSGRCTLTSTARDAISSYLVERFQ